MRRQQLEIRKKVSNALTGERSYRGVNKNALFFAYLAWLSNEI